jgi:hypothetical protein
MFLLGEAIVGRPAWLGVDKLSLIEWGFDIPQ